jgi:hypothetical protein
MTPQELEGTVEFILQHQAQTVVHLERLAQSQGEMQSLLVQMTELAQVQSRRLDRHDDTLRSIDGTLRSIQVWQQEALSRLDRILDRLTRDRG